MRKRAQKKKKRVSISALSRYRYVTLGVISVLLLGGVFWSRSFFTPRPHYAVAASVPGSEMFMREDTVGQEKTHTVFIESAEKFPSYKYQFTSSGVRLLLDRKDGKGFVALYEGLSVQTEYKHGDVWVAHDLAVNTVGSQVLSGYEKTQLENGTTVVKRTYKATEEGVTEGLEEVWTIPKTVEDMREKGPKVEFKMSSNHKAAWRMKWVYSGISEITKTTEDIRDTKNWPIRRKTYAKGAFTIDVNDFDNLQKTPNHTFSELKDGKVEIVFYPQGIEGERHIDPTLVVTNIATPWDNHARRPVFFNGTNFFVLYDKGGTSIYAKGASTVASLPDAEEQIIINGGKQNVGGGWDIYLVDDTKFDVAYIDDADVQDFNVSTCTFSNTTITCSGESNFNANAGTIQKVTVARTGSDRIWVTTYNDIAYANQTGDSSSITSWTNNDGALQSGQPLSTEQVTMIGYGSSDKVIVINIDDPGGTNSDTFQYTTCTFGVSCVGTNSQLVGHSAPNGNFFGNLIRISDSDFRFIYVNTANDVIETKFDGNSTWNTTYKTVHTGTDASASVFYDKTANTMYSFWVDTATSPNRVYYASKTCASGSGCTEGSWSSPILADNSEADSNSRPVVQMVESPTGSSRITPRQLTWAYRNANGSNFDVVVGNLELAAAVSPTSTPTPTPTPSSAKLYWKFDDGQGTTAQDSTSNNLDGTVSDSTNWRSEDICVSGKCMYFDGANNDNVSVSDNANVDFTDTDAFSVGAWVRRNGASSAINYLISKADTTNGGYKLWMDDDGDFCFGIDDDATWTPDVSACSTNRNYDDDRWHHVMGVKSEGDNKIYIYVDGLEVSGGGSIDTTTATLANSNTFYVGVDRDGTSNEWLGFIDEVKVYSEEMTAAKVKAEFNAINGGKRSSAVLGSNSLNQPAALANGLVGYWKMDDGSGNATDSSGNSLTLTNNNTVAYARGKFGYAGSFTAASLTYFSTATTISGVKTVSFWTYNAATTDEYINLVASSAYITSSNGTVSATGFSAPKVYVNGVLNGTLTASAWNVVVVVSDTAVNATDFEIGRGNGAYNNGLIDDIRLYNRALSAGDITNLYNWAPGLVGQWNFEEGSGTTAYDKSGNGNTGTITAGTGSYTTGKFGKGYSFDGSSTLVNIPSSANYDATTGTWEGWVNTTLSPGANGNLLMTRGDVTSSYNGITLFVKGAQTAPSGALRVQIKDGSSTVLTLGNVANNIPVNDGKWHHWALTFNGTSTAYLYVDGQLIHSGSPSGSWSFNSQAVRLGISNDSFWGKFSGIEDEIRIYNYARTSKQIIEDMNAGHPAPGSPVGSALGYWKFDEGIANRCSGGTNDTCNSGNGGTSYDGAFSAAAPSYTPSGKFGKAVAFTGATPTYSDIGDATGTEGISQMTWSFWINPSTLSTGDCIFCKANTAGATQRSWMISTGNADSSKVRAIVFDTATDALTLNYAETPTGMLNNGTWTHVVVVYDASEAAANRIRFYINGKSQTASITGTIPSDGTVATTSNARIGSSSDATAADSLTGILDEVKIYTGALTATQAQVEYNRGSNLVLGALSNTAGLTGGTVASNSASSEYCIPGDTSTCTAPVGRWDFEEGSGTNVYDTSGNGNTGTWNGTGSHWTIGRTGNGKAGVFTSATSDNVDAGSVPGANVTTFTVEVWTRWNALGTQGMILSKGTNTNGNNWHLTLRGGTSFVATVWGNSSTNEVIFNSPPAIGVWYHYAAVYSTSAGTTTITTYVNGVKQNSGTSTVVLSAPNGTNLFIGSNVTQSSQTGNANIDGVRIYNYARTAQQIAWDYNRGAPTGWWKMDECQGTTLNDSTGNSLTGTWTGTGAGVTSVGTCSTAATARGNGATGKRNYSLDFDGTDDVITVTNMNKIDIDSNLVNFTFSTWVYADTAGEGSGGQIFNKTTNNYLRVDSLSGGKLDVEANLDRATTDANINVSSAISSGTWNYITETWDGTTLKLYINGVLQGTATGTGAVTADTGNLLIGGDTSNNFDGKIDDFRVYNYALNATQITTAMNDGAVRFGPLTGSP